MSYDLGAGGMSTPAMTSYYQVGQSTGQLVVMFFLLVYWLVCGDVVGLAYPIGKRGSGMDMSIISNPYLCPIVRLTVW